MFLILVDYEAFLVFFWLCLFFFYLGRYFSFHNHKRYRTISVSTVVCTGKALSFNTSYNDHILRAQPLYKSTSFLSRVVFFFLFHLLSVARLSIIHFVGLIISSSFDIFSHVLQDLIKTGHEFHLRVKSLFKRINLLRRLCVLLLATSETMQLENG